MERVEKEIVNLSIGNFMDQLEKESNEPGEGGNERLKVADCCESSCSSEGFCFNPNSTTTQRTTDV